jgi:hypothetical protein
MRRQIRARRCLRRGACQEDGACRQKKRECAIIHKDQLTFRFNDIGQSPDAQRGSQRHKRPGNFIPNWSGTGVSALFAAARYALKPLYFRQKHHAKKLARLSQY